MDISGILGSFWTGVISGAVGYAALGFVIKKVLGSDFVVKKVCFYIEVWIINLEASNRPVGSAIKEVLIKLSARLNHVLKTPGIQHS